MTKSSDANRSQKRSKDWGREVENEALRKLRLIYPRLKRVGSLGYSGNHPDLIQEGDGDNPPRYNLVVTRDKNAKDIMVSMTYETLKRMIFDDDYGPLVVVQCKGRAKTWLGGVMRGLQAWKSKS